MLSSLATVTADWNLLLNAAGLLALVVAALRIGNSRRYRENISDLESVAAAKDLRLTELEKDVEGVKERAASAEARAIEAEKAVAMWEARYQELSRYTAKSAVEHFELMMSEHSARVAERHARMLEHLERLESTLAESARANGELVLKSIEIQSRIAHHLDVSTG